MALWAQRLGFVLSTDYADFRGLIFFLPQRLKGHKGWLVMDFRALLARKAFPR
jgi:hypothetical protein